MMLYSGTTSHLTPKSRTTRHQGVYETSKYFADDSDISSTHVGVCKIDARNDDGDRRISLSDILVVLDASMNLMSIPALVRKEIAVLFMPGYATLLNIRGDLKTLWYGTKNAEGLFYVNNDGSTQPPSTAKSSVAHVLAMMAKNMSKLTLKTIGKDDSSNFPMELGKCWHQKSTGSRIYHWRQLFCHYSRVQDEACCSLLCEGINFNCFGVCRICALLWATNRIPNQRNSYRWRNRDLPSTIRTWGWRNLHKCDQRIYAGVQWTSGENASNTSWKYKSMPVARKGSLSIL